jgi:stress response protein YsnF
MDNIENRNNGDNPNRLQELGGSDFEISDNQPNIKGWDVKDSAGRLLGDIDELLFDTSSRKVRYIVLDLHENEHNTTSKKVLIPIGLATLHEEDDDVIIQDVTTAQIQRLPEYDKDNVSPAYESSIRNIFSMSGGTEGTVSTEAYSENDGDFYDHDHFDEDQFYGNRRDNSTQKLPIIEENLNVGKIEEETGAARITTSIQEHEVEEPIHLREEHVHVNRNPTDRPATDEDFQTFEEGEMEVRAHKEVPVVNKEARVVEEVNIRKEVTEEEEIIRDKVRRTEVDVENTDSSNRDRYDDADKRDYDEMDESRNRSNRDSGGDL